MTDVQVNTPRTRSDLGIVARETTAVYFGSRFAACAPVRIDAPPPDGPPLRSSSGALLQTSMAWHADCFLPRSDSD